LIAATPVGAATISRLLLSLFQLAKECRLSGSGLAGKKDMAAGVADKILGKFAARD
jgi:hypothetical protein